MTSEEMERAIEFLLQSQAKHDSQIAELNRVITMQSESQSQFNESITQAVTSLIESQRRTDERLAETNERVDRVVAMMAQESARRAESETRHARRYDELDARLDRLVSVVERLAERG